MATAFNKVVVPKDYTSRIVQRGETNKLNITGTITVDDTSCTIIKNTYDIVGEIEHQFAGTSTGRNIISIPNTNENSVRYLRCQIEISSVVTNNYRYIRFILRPYASILNTGSKTIPTVSMSLQVVVDGTRVGSISVKVLEKIAVGYQKDVGDVSIVYDTIAKTLIDDTPNGVESWVETPII